MRISLSSSYLSLPSRAKGQPIALAKVQPTIPQLTNVICRAAAQATFIAAPTQLPHPPVPTSRRRPWITTTWAPPAPAQPRCPSMRGPHRASGSTIQAPALQAPTLSLFPSVRPMNGNSLLFPVIRPQPHIKLTDCVLPYSKSSLTAPVGAPAAVYPDPNSIPVDVPNAYGRADGSSIWPTTRQALTSGYFTQGGAPIMGANLTSNDGATTLQSMLNWTTGGRRTGHPALSSVRTLF